MTKDLRGFLIFPLFVNKVTIDAIMLNTGLLSIRCMNERLLIFGGIAAAIVIMTTAVFPFWNLIPTMVTEEVTVKAVDQDGCYVETHDHFVIKIPPCNAQPGQNITATFDAKVRDREKQI